MKGLLEHPGTSLARLSRLSRFPSVCCMEVRCLLSFRSYGTVLVPGIHGPLSSTKIHRSRTYTRFNRNCKNAGRYKRYKSRAGSRGTALCRTATASVYLESHAKFKGVRPESRKTLTPNNGTGQVDRTPAPFSAEGFCGMVAKKSQAVNIHITHIHQLRRAQRLRLQAAEVCGISRGPGLQQQLDEFDSDLTGSIAGQVEWCPASGCTRKLEKT